MIYIKNDYNLLRLLSTVLLNQKEQPADIITKQTAHWHLDVALPSTWTTVMLRKYLIYYCCSRKENQFLVNVFARYTFYLRIATADTLHTKQNISAYTHIYTLTLIPWSRLTNSTFLSSFQSFHIWLGSQSDRVDWDPLRCFTDSLVIAL